MSENEHERSCRTVKNRFEIIVTISLSSLHENTLQYFLRQDHLTWPVNREPSKLMDAIDILLVDHLIQNIDRHIYYFEPVKYSSMFLLDHGKGLVFSVLHTLQKL